jgi:uncharacterized membrane protein (DUF2068 family)
MARPVGVTILAILDFLGAVFCILAGLGFMLSGGMIAAMLSQNSQLSSQIPAGVAGIVGGLGVGVGVGMLILAVINALLGWGLWKLKNWARVITLIFTVLGGLSLALCVLLSLVHFSLLGIIWYGFWLAIYGLIIWYLLKPDVKRAFA